MKTIIQNIKSNYKLLISVLVIGLFIGWIIAPSGNTNNTGDEHAGHQHEQEEPSTWTCSMHPQIKQDKPGLCPICAMDLIPLTTMQSGGDDTDPNEIVMSESAAKLADIQTTIVTIGEPIKSIYLQGKIHVDERRIAELTARFGGRIEQLNINFTGQNVRKGQKLATIYSPELVSAQRELIEASEIKNSSPSLYKATRAKLKAWDLSDEQINAIEQSGEPTVYFDVLSPITGTVMMRHVAKGDYVKEGVALFKVADLTKLWAMFDAYESDLPWIKNGDKISFTMQALPGKVYEAKVTFVDPIIDAKTRVAKVRVEIDNKALKLKPEMFATGLLESKFAMDKQAVLIPKTAVLWTGKRSVVYTKIQERETPTFLYREITLGPEAGINYVVTEGLEEGEEIATNGVFKIDAAAQLIGLPSMMNADGGVVPTGHNHGGEPMSQSEMEKMDKEPEKYNVSADFKKQLTEVYNKYLLMKDAFIVSNAHNVMTAATDLESALKEVDMGLLKGDAHMAWMEYSKVIEKSTISISKIMDIEKQRSEFAKFNIAFYKSLKAFGLNDVTAYYQYCPMADKDKGAYWFSNSEEIKNPYFGDAMLGCGENRETVK